MTIGIFLAMGDSFKEMTKTGQDIAFKKFYLSKFSKNFSKVYIFSYADEKIGDLPKNVYLIPNKYKIHRYFYSIILPFINYRKVLRCDVFRAYHLFGTPPAVITKILYNKPFVFNWAYDYEKIAVLESRFLNLILLKLLRLIATNTTSLVFAANEAIFRELFSKKTLYLPNGVNTKFFRPNLNKKIASRKTVILSVGRLEKQKNFENLVLAINGIDAKLRIVGNGTYKVRLKKLSQKIGVDLEIISKVDNQQMPLEYNNADIFILPSTVEGSPKALLEAMACGLPVIASDIDGVKDIITNGKTGLLTSTNKKSIKSSLTKLLSDKGLAKKIANNGRAEVQKKFNLDDLLKLEVNSIKKIFKS